jgi:pectinesterase
MSGKITHLIFIIFCFFMFKLQTSYAQQKTYDIIVAADGTGNYAKLQQAINTVPAFSSKTTTIFIKKGIYKEKIEIPSWRHNIYLIGENAEETIISWNDYAGNGGINTFTSYTMRIQGDDIKLENLRVENTAGPVGQAVAIHVEGNRCEFRNCIILGNQDTLYISGENSHHYFKGCYIDGTTDFIFGSATAVFEGCTILSKKDSYVTAASTPKGNTFGFVFMNCKLIANQEITTVYLGRPWRDYARVVFLNCELGKHIIPEGWHNWSKPEREKTAFYAEYNNSGPGAEYDKRVPWSHQLTKQQAKEYTVENILSYKKWILSEFAQ